MLQCSQPSSSFESSLRHSLWGKASCKTFATWAALALATWMKAGQLAMACRVSEYCSPIVLPGHGKFMKIASARDDLLAILNHKADPVGT